MLESNNKIIRISGKVIPLIGNNIDTDRIIPARFLKEITFENLGKYAFYDERFVSNKETNHPFNTYNGGSILLVNKNFGCGSSREHAPQSLKKYGIKSVIGESFADIFKENCFKIGIPLITISNKEIEHLIKLVENNKEQLIQLDFKTQQITFGDYSINFELNPVEKESFLDGSWDSISKLFDGKEEIAKIRNKLPYLNNFRGF